MIKWLFTVTIYITVHSNPNLDFSHLFSFSDPINPCLIWKPYNPYYFLSYSPPKPNPNSSKSKLYQIYPLCSKLIFVVPLILLQYHKLFPSIFFFFFWSFYFNMNFLTIIWLQRWDWWRFEKCGPTSTSRSPSFYIYHDLFHWCCVFCFLLLIWSVDSQCKMTFLPVVLIHWLNHYCKKCCLQLQRCNYFMAFARFNEIFFFFK